MDPIRPSQPNPRRRVLGILIRGPLGCLSFLAGAAVVSIVLFPPACSRTVTETLETHFNDRFQGRLQLEEAWLLALYGSQTIERVTLYDDEGVPIVSGAMNAPNVFDVAKRWLDIGDRPGTDDAPIELDFGPVHVDQRADGSTNVGRALLGRGAPERHGERLVDWSGIVPGHPFGVGSGPYFRVRVEELTWENDVTRGRARPIRFGKLTGTAVKTRFVQKELFQLELSGELPGGGTVTFSYTLEDVWGFLRDEHAPFGIVTLELSGAPTELLDDLARADGRLVRAFGPNLKELRLMLMRTAMGESRIDVHVESTTTNFDLAGILLHDQRTIVARETGRLTADFALGTYWTDEVLDGLLPLVGSWQPGGAQEDDDQARGRVSVVSFELPLDAGPARLSGLFRFDLGTASCELSKAFVAALPDVDEPTRVEPAPTQLRLDVRDGVVTFEDVMLGAGSEPLTIGGDYQLSSGKLRALVNLPARLAHDASRRDIELEGTPAALTLIDTTNR